jgi:hypothetical protein
LPGLPVKPTPVIIKFDKPTTADQARNIFLLNPNNRPVLFAVKTTAPKRYCVRPNRGHIKPGELVTVEILLVGFSRANQEWKDSPPPNYQDKFLVQSFTIPPWEMVPDLGINFANRKCAEVKMKVEFSKGSRWKRELPLARA